MRSLPLCGVGRALVVLALVAVAPSRATAAADDPASRPSQTSSLSPENAVSAALSLHPDIRAASADIATARAQLAEAVPLVGNPTVSASTTLSGDRSGAGAELPISLSGIRLAERRSASASVDAGEATLRRRSLEIASETRRAWTASSVASAQASLAEEAAALSQRFSNGVSLAAEAGNVSVLDERVARLAYAGAAVRLLDARATEAEALRDLAAMTGLVVSAGTLTGTPLDGAPDPIEARSGSNRSDVAAARLRVQAAEAGLTAARAATIPSLTVGWAIENEDALRFQGPSIGLELPLFRRNQSGRASAAGAVEVARSELAILEAVASVEVSSARVRVQEARQLVQQAGDDLLADGTAALRGVEIAFSAGEIDLTTAVLLQSEIIDGQAAALDLQARVVDARLDLLLALEDPRLLAGGTP